MQAQKIDFTQDVGQCQQRVKEDCDCGRENAQTSKQTLKRFRWPSARIVVRGATQEVYHVLLFTYLKFGNENL